MKLTLDLDNNTRLNTPQIIAIDAALKAGIKLKVKLNNETVPNKTLLNYIGEPGFREAYRMGIVNSLTIRLRFGVN